MAHTPEPWAVDPDERAEMEWNNHILGATGERICFMAHDGTPTNAAGEANAARIVACINALAGIPTDKLRPGIVKELIDAARQAVHEAADLIRAQAAHIDKLMEKGGPKP